MKKQISYLTFEKRPYSGRYLLVWRFEGQRRNRVFYPGKTKYWGFVSE